MCWPEIQNIRRDVASAGRPRGAEVGVGGQTEQGSLLPPPHPPVSPASPTADPAGSRRAGRRGLRGGTEQGKDMGPQACPHPESHSRAGLAQAGISRSEWRWPTRGVMFGGCSSWGWASRWVQW